MKTKKISEAEVKEIQDIAHTIRTAAEALGLSHRNYANTRRGMPTSAHYRPFTTTQERKR